MLYLVDTNVLLRIAIETEPLYPKLSPSIARIYRRGDELRRAAQNCIEFWNVVTRPVDCNGLGLTPQQADQLLVATEDIFPTLEETPSVYHAWRSLVASFQVSGVKVHDAHLVALMQVHQLTHILTLNADDFRRYASLGIVAVDPLTV